MAQMVKSLPAVQETWIRSLGQEDPLEKEMAPTPVFLPGKSQGQRSLVDYSPWGHKESDMTEQLHFKEERKRGKGFIKINTTKEIKIPRD